MFCTYKKNECVFDNAVGIYLTSQGLNIVVCLLILRITGPWVCSLGPVSQKFT